MKLRRSKCRKCCKCICEDYDSYMITCEVFGRTNEKYTCRYYITAKEIELLKRLKTVQDELDNKGE